MPLLFGLQAVDYQQMTVVYYSRQYIVDTLAPIVYGTSNIDTAFLFTHDNKTFVCEKSDSTGVSSRYRGLFFRWLW